MKIQERSKLIKQNY